MVLEITKCETVRSFYLNSYQIIYIATAELNSNQDLKLNLVHDKLCNFFLRNCHTVASDTERILNLYVKIITRVIPTAVGGFGS